MSPNQAEAAAALAVVRQAEATMRSVFRARRGHYYLWLWGALWVMMALLAHFRGLAGVALFPWICVGGAVTSFAIGFFQNNQVRVPVDRRFLGALAVLLGFALLWPILFHPTAPSAKLLFTYMGLVVAQVYILTGLWFDTYLLWLGLILSALILAGFFWFLPIFWLWIAVGCGGTLILSGFYVRYFWR
jgi:hypothetical protein